MRGLGLRSEFKDSAALFDPRGKLIDIPEPENPKKELRCSVEKRAAQFIRTAYDPDEIPIKQLTDQFPALNAAYRFDRCPEDGLLVSDDRERFHRGGREPHFDRLLVQTPEPRRELRTRHQLKSAADLDGTERTPATIISLIQLLHKMPSLPAVSQIGELRQASRVERLAGKEEDSFESPQRGGLVG